jgi:tetratricopeptide (TPR) repeat protein
MTARVGRAAVAAAFAATYGVQLFGVPSCSLGPIKADAALVRVDQLIAKHEFTTALPLALDNRRRHSADASVRWQLARVYEGLARPADEAAAWQDYLELSQPTNPACERLSSLYTQLDQPARVIAIVDRCLSFDDDQPALLADQAAAYLKMGNRAAAVAGLTRALAIDRDPALAARLDDLKRSAP